MKSATLFYLLTLTTMISFLLSYFAGLTFDNPREYIAILTVIAVDGFFGIWAGIKREGFKTYKAIKIVKTVVFWVIMLTTVLAVEKGFPAVDWLSETILPPFIVFQLISILKNASIAGFISNRTLNSLLSTIDQHKHSK